MQRRCVDRRWIVAIAGRTGRSSRVTDRVNRVARKAADRCVICYLPSPALH